MAYAAVVSLAQTLEQQIVLYDGDDDEHPPGLVEKEKLVLLQSKVSTILSYIEEHSSDKCSKEMVDLLENRIIDAAYKAEEIVEIHFPHLNLSAACYKTETACINFSFECLSESHASHQYKSWLKKRRVCGKERRVRGDLQKVLQEIDLILQEIIKINNSSTTTTTHSVSASAAQASHSSEQPMVEFDDDYNKVKALLY